MKFLGTLVALCFFAGAWFYTLNQRRLTELEESFTTLQVTLTELRREAAQAREEAAGAGEEAQRERESARARLESRSASEQSLILEVARLRAEVEDYRAAAATAAAALRTGDTETYRRSLDTVTQVAPRRSSAGEAAQGAGTVPPPVPASAPSPPPPGPEPVATEIASVGPSNSFIILSHGSAAGARRGQEVVIQRGGVTLASAVIREAREDLSIADVRTTSLRSTLTKGDIAIVSP